MTARNLKPGHKYVSVDGEKRIQIDSYSGGIIAVNWLDHRKYFDGKEYSSVGISAARCVISDWKEPVKRQMTQVEACQLIWTLAKESMVWIRLAGDCRICPYFSSALLYPKDFEYSTNLKEWKKFEVVE